MSWNTSSTHRKIRPIIPCSHKPRVMEHAVILATYFKPSWGIWGAFAIKSEVDVAHIEQQRRYGRVTLQVDQTQTVREVALSGTNEKQPAWCEEREVTVKVLIATWPWSQWLVSILWLPWSSNDWSVKSSIAGHGHWNGDDPLERPKDCISKCLQGENHMAC